MSDNAIAKLDALAQFNKINGVFVTVIGKVTGEEYSWLNHDNYIYKEVQIDDEREKIVGTVNDFKIVLKEAQPLEVYEHALNSLAREKIVGTYSLERQLSILGTVLERVADANAVECEELKEMNDFIAEIKYANQLRKEFFQSDPDYQYLSVEQIEELVTARQEGGIAAYGQTLAHL